MSVPNNVTRLEQPNSVTKHINAFLESCAVKSENTMVAYKLDIEQFFKYMRNKEINELTEDDLNFKNIDMVQYQSFMFRDKKYSNKTINRKMNSIVKLFRVLKKNDYNVDPEKLKVDDLSDDSQSIGFLTVEEINSMLEVSNNLELNVFIKLALRTGLRKQAILDLTWDQIRPDDFEKGKYIIMTMDKGKQVEAEIFQMMHDEIMFLKTDVSNKIFTTPLSTIDYRFGKLCEAVGIDEKRKVSPHSLKKAGIWFVREETNSLHAAQMQGKHSSPAVTSKSYLPKTLNPASALLDKKMDKKVFDELSRDELLKLVKGFKGGGQYQLCKDATDIIENRS